MANNETHAANGGGGPLLPNRAPWAAAIAHFCRLACDHTMKADLLLVALLCLLWGCTASTRDVNTTARLPGLISSQEVSAAPQHEPVIPQPPRPVVYFAGEFTRTGRFAWTNGLTLKDGIDVAGGFTKWADGSLHLIHRNGSKELYHLGPRRTLTNNPALQPEDAVISRGHVDAF